MVAGLAGEVPYSARQRKRHIRIASFFPWAEGDVLHPPSCKVDETERGQLTQREVDGLSEIPDQLET